MKARGLLAALWFAPAVLAAAGAGLPDFTARYTVAKAELDVISTTITLRRGARIEYRAESEPVGLAAWFFGDHRIHELSVLKQIENQVIPLAYRYVHEGSEENRNEHYQYDWTRNVADVYSRGQQRTQDPRRHLGQLVTATSVDSGCSQARQDVPLSRHLAWRAQDLRVSESRHGNGRERAWPL